MTWDSFRQRVRYLRGEALSSWPPSITNVILQPISPRHPDDPIAGVHVWCIGSVPAHGMRRGSLLHCSIPTAADNCSAAVGSSSAVVFQVPVAALRSVWMDPDCHAMMDCDSLALLRYLQTAAIERLLWHKDTGMVILADKGRRWIEARIECSRPTIATKGPQASSGEPHVLFTECSLADSLLEPPDAAEQLRENDWYYERGGKGGRFIAFSRSSNVVVYDTLTRRETQVTWAKADGVQYGAVDISMEEELGRTAGVFWQQQPESADSPNGVAAAVAVDRMLCARVDERHVMSVGLPELPPSLAGNKADSSASTIREPASLFADSRYGWDSGCAYHHANDEYGKSTTAGYLTDFQKYSRPGTPGALTDWVIIEIEHTSGGGIVRQRVRPLHERFRLSTLFPWCEYVVRAGWMPASGTAGSAAVWLQLLDRPQKRTAIVRIPLGCFAPGIVEPYDPLDEDACNIHRTLPPPPPPAPNAHIDILYEEEQPDAWINLNHTLRFLSSSSSTAIRFIIASERTGGFNHLHLVAAHITQPPGAASYVWQARQEIVPLTGGSWPVTDDAPVFVDETRNLVYFSARRPNPLTTNLFATSYHRSLSGNGDLDAPLWQLTCSGYTHSHFAFDPSGAFFYCQSSNLTTPVRHCVYVVQRPQTGFRRSLVVRNDPPFVRRNSSRLPLDGSLEDMPCTTPPPPDDCLSDTMSFYSASCEPPTHEPVSARCLCVLEISGAPLLRLDPLISPDSSGVRRMSSIRNPPVACRLSVCSSSSSLISLSSQSQSVDSIASDEMFVERLLSKLRTSGQSIQHSTLASDLMKLKRLTPAYVSQRVTKAVRSALPFCSTPTIIPRHLLHSSLLQPLARTSRTTSTAAAAAAVVGKEPLAATRPSSPHLIHKKQLLVEDASQATRDQDIPMTQHFVSSLTSSTRTFIARETLLGIDKAMQPGGNSGDPVPRLFCVPVPRNRHRSGSEPDYELVFGHVYLPPDFKPGHQYPTVVNAYGGPQCQLVTNAFPYPRHRRLAMLTRMTPAVAKPGTVPEFVPRGEDEVALTGGVFGDDVRSIVGMHATVVVCLDGRGTPHRGLGFEAAIRGRLGRLEVDDIVCALEYLCTYGLSCIDPVRGMPPEWCRHTMSAAMAEKEKDDEEEESRCWGSFLRPPVFAPNAHAVGDWDTPPHATPRLFIDRKSVAIHGWSYGGYVALRALARYPDWFRLAVAGAPVVRWDWYSSAYIERYLGVLGPQTKQVYEDASITAAAVADRLLPSAREHGRILVVHGWNDDNVHVAHTAALVRELNEGSDAAAQLCIYANERHGLKLPSSNEHFETMLSFWLFHFLQGSSS
ncbi:hypothetical protein LPJ81_000037 [Coemansia sp. IMI 209127]|nr:hypothetical protein LPJ81_000037 [Coemansia sp. IMI 209127]